MNEYAKELAKYMEYGSAFFENIYKFNDEKVTIVTIVPALFSKG